MVRLAGRHAIATTAAACCALVGLTLVTTYLVIQVGFREPHLISIGEDSRTASLMSQLGTPLHIWRSTREGGINDAKLFEAGESMRPRMRIATSILLPADLDPELHGQLCIWAADDPSRLLWRTSAVGDLAAPREAVRSLATSGDLLKLKQEVYGAGYFTIAEVFDQSAGKEIITTHHLQIDPTAIRIYSAGGEVLFEAWHWGAAHQPLWLAEEGLIVLAACNNEHRLTEHGIENPNLGWPRIIFAIRPELGARWEYVNPNLARPGEAAEWYRCLLPLDAANELATNLSPQIHLAAAGEAPIRLHYFVRPRATPDASLHFEIDAHGIVLNSFPSDAWRQTRHPLRNVELHLGDLPAPPGPGG